MEILLAWVSLILILILFASIVWLIYSVIKKKSKRTPAIIAIVSLVLAGTSLAIYGNTDTESNSSETSADNQPQKQSAIKEFGKESIYYQNGEKQFGIAIKSIDQNWNEFAQEQTSYGSDMFNGKQSQSLQITVDYKNYNLDNDFLPSWDSFKIYNSDNSAANILDYQVPQTEVSKGHSGTTTFWVTLNKPIDTSKKLTIEYSADGTSTGRATFKLPITIN